MEVPCLALKDLTSPDPGLRGGAGEDDDGRSEQKENVCMERRRATPLKSAESTVPALLRTRKGATPDLAHVTPIKHSSLGEPWTPTANLKMLISAASPDIRDREMRKVLFRPIENEKGGPGSPEAGVERVEDSNQEEEEEEEEEDGVDRKPSRKKKSLGLLCQKFLALYPDYPPAQRPIWISLDEVATGLGVERRRIYDIVNVLESLMIVGRIAKNSYTWNGRQQLEATLQELQRRGRQQGYHLQVALGSGAGGGGAHGAQGHHLRPGSNRKDKSLRIMSQKFVMLFLVSRTQTVALDTAARILIEESRDASSHSKYKTKVRRLYDIANVLTSLGLIKKVHVREERGRKPAFRWLGPVEFSPPAGAGSTVVNLAGATQPMARHASFSIAAPSVAIQRRVSSAPVSPRPEGSAPPPRPSDCSRRNTACRLRFGNGTSGGSSAAPQMEPPPTPCLAYLPSLSQPSVVMLYAALDKHDPVAEGPSSTRAPSEEGRKRRSEDEEEGGAALRKKGTPELEEGAEVRAVFDVLGHSSDEAGATMSGNNRTSPGGPAGLSGGPGGRRPVQPAHYLYIPNNTGLNGLNFLVSAGQHGAAGPPSGAPSVALPYLLLPSAALSHYPLLASSLPQQGSDAHHQLSFSLPTVLPPAHFMVGAVPCGLAAASEVSRSPPTPERGSGAATPRSPPGPPTPPTPKEATPSAPSKAFFQTPGTLGNAAPAARKRGSAQRRLDVSHAPSKRLDV
ncbi:transcription factor E2F7 [Brachionichthys hirsutus]|uniref:transcription factor E2F7 n=1 Tax=Brachionichthys hirsutus TaxID=412623 RepID=UPI00360520DD